MLGHRNSCRCYNTLIVVIVGFVFETYVICYCKIRGKEGLGTLVLGKKINI